MVADLAWREQRAGDDVTVLALSEGTGALRAELAMRRLNVVAIAKRDGRDLGAPGEVARVVRALRPEIVHTHNPQALVYAAWPARITGATVVHTKHGVNPGSRRALALRRVASLALGAYVAVSEEIAALARARREARAAIVHVIPNAVDVAHFQRRDEARARLRGLLRADGDVVLGTLGRIVPEKDLPLLLRAARPLLAGPAARTRVVVAGDGPELPRLAALVAEWDAPARARVAFLGHRPDVADVLSAFDVFALSSTTEGLPMAVLEAMSTGLPIVATRVGGLASLLEGSGAGTLVAPRDEPRLRDALAEVCNDALLREKRGAAARAHMLAHYDAQAAADRYRELYARVRAADPVARLGAML
jgi:glycosyltransferase involved in cell wall biosynthesis